MRKFLWIAAALLALSFAAPAFADGTYTINFTATSGQDVTGSFAYENGVFSNFDITWSPVAVAPISFSLTSAANAVSPLTTIGGCSSPGLFAYLTENGCGSNFNTWDVRQFFEASGDFSFDSGADGSVALYSLWCCGSSPGGWGQAAAGSFTVAPAAVTTPEPASLILLGIGFLGIAAAWRCKKIHWNFEPRR